MQITPEQYSAVVNGFSAHCKITSDIAIEQIASLEQQLKDKQANIDSVMRDAKCFQDLYSARIGAVSDALRGSHDKQALPEDHIARTETYSFAIGFRHNYTTTVDMLEQYRRENDNLKAEIEALKAKKKGKK